MSKVLDQCVLLIRARPCQRPPEPQTHEGMAPLLSIPRPLPPKRLREMVKPSCGTKLAAFSKNIHLSSGVFPAKDCSPTETAPVEVHETCHLGLGAINSAFTFI